MSQEINQNALIYKNEPTLFKIKFVISLIFWLVLIVGTIGIALFYMLMFYVMYLFAQSALISHLKGNAIKVSVEQFPDIYQAHVQCCKKLEMNTQPDIYLLNGGGILNAFATHFLGRNFVVLYSNIVDAMESHPDAINFYLGHELGHIKRKHIKWGAFLAPASILPLLGSAYSRAHEYTCDMHGRACCDNPESALFGLVALAAGDKRWKQVNMNEYLTQANQSSGFWMSFHELTADYPWLVKRAARIQQPIYKAPTRNIFAGILALFVPRMGAGAGGGVLVTVAIIGILAAVAIPAYKDYQNRAQMAQHMSELYQQNSPELGESAAQ